MLMYYICTWHTLLHLYIHTYACVNTISALNFTKSVAAKVVAKKKKKCKIIWNKTIKGKMQKKKLKTATDNMMSLFMIMNFYATDDDLKRFKCIW